MTKNLPPRLPSSRKLPERTALNGLQSAVWRWLCYGSDRMTKDIDIIANKFSTLEKIGELRHKFAGFSKARDEYIARRKITPCFRQF